MKNKIKDSTSCTFKVFNPTSFCVCPVCGGNGLVPKGFYNQTSGTWTTGTIIPFEKCKSCDGTGVVWK
jgi:hypothetical protein